MATANDQSLQSVTTCILSGWPNTKALTPTLAKPFWNYRDELTVEDGIVFRGERVVIPTTMQRESLKTIHQAHLGIERCKQRARDLVFWPGMNKQIEELVNNCSTCCKYQHNAPKEPMQPHPIPERPWEREGADLFEFNRKNYIILVDYYSGFIEVDYAQETTMQ